MNLNKFEDFNYGDWYIDWCTGINGYYSGPHQVRCKECLDNVFTVSWGMIEKVSADHPKCPEPPEFAEENGNYK